PPQRFEWTEWLIALGYVLALTAFFATLRAWTKRKKSSRPSDALPALALFVGYWTSAGVLLVCAPSLVARIRSIAPVASPSWWHHHAVEVAVVVGAVLTLTIGLVAIRRKRA